MKDMHWTDFLGQAEAITKRYQQERPKDFDVYNAAVVGSIAAAAIGIGGSIYSGIQQSRAARDANNQNARNVAETNRMNLQMHRESRGSEGFARLPYFGVDRQGNPVEPQLFQDAYGVYQSTADFSSPQALAEYQALVNQGQQAQAGATQTVNDLFGGQRADRMVGNQQPVYDARMGLATLLKNSKMEALKKKLNDIKAWSAKKGFSGTGSGQQKMAYEATRDANASGAIDIGQARLANVSDEAGIRNRDEDLKLSNLQLPYAIAQQGLNMKSLPLNSVINNHNSRLGSLGFFNIGTSQFQYQPLPQVQPVANTGQIVGQGIAAAGNMGMQYGLNQLAFKQQQQANTDYINAINNASGPTIYPSIQSAMNN